MLIELEGYLDSFTGQGEAARLNLVALEAAGVEVETVSLAVEQVDTGPAAESIDAPAGGEAIEAGVKPDAKLLCVNGIELGAFTELRGAEYFYDCPVAGYWQWETDLVPERLTASAHLLDEIWVPSKYVAENLGAAVEVPVAVVPHPAIAPAAGDAAPPFELPAGFKFLFSFSYLSTIERKNPLGLIEAFSRAFEPGEGPQLILKSVNGSRIPDSLARVEHAAAARPDVHLFDGLIEPAGNAALLEACDCYASLHRSEGFGLTIAEAMAAGKPVVATAYSGNMDFMTPQNSLLVEAEVVRIGEGGAVYPADGHWADPDLDAAAEAMRRVWQDSELAGRIGEQGRRDVSERLSPAAVGEIARDRLERLIGE